MRLKLALAIITLLFVLGSCKKDNYLTLPATNNPPKTLPKTPLSFTLANTLQSNMVIQRNKPLNIWGTAAASSKIILKTSWLTDSVSTTADASGNWELSINIGSANATPQTITATVVGGKSISLKNILIGDVWICSGQSNMVMQVDSIAPFQGVTNYKSEIAAANYPNIRVLTLQTDYKVNPVDTLSSPASWTVCSPQTAGDISGVAYYFARKLNIDMNVPIGIIVSAVDGTSCEAWTNEAAFEANPDLAVYAGINNATALYNGMISPLKTLSITGFIWYQGENNKTNNPVSDYTKLNSALIVGWRAIFNQGNLPFYLVQMPPFAQDYFTTTPVGGDLTEDSYAKFREAQANVLNVLNTGMAITMDVGEPNNQHPPDKKPVGERLALLAEKNTYNQSVQCYGPQYSSYVINSNTVTISFKNSSGLNTINNLPLNQYFYIAGNNQVFERANAQIVNDQIVLTAPANFSLPIMAIRYAFTEAPVTNLQNSAGLPMEPFRTDNWSN
ncbi:sialate O-acetylesterase [Mucilaginibacter sp.]